MFETIVALATPPLRSALAIVRLSGDNCLDIVDNFFSKELKTMQNNRILHGFILDSKEIVDDVVLLLYKNPHSFTGEDSVEIICHGSPLIYNKIIELSLKYGARLATGGEFTSRAYMHNKMDLVQAESINDLINAESEESKKLSLLSLTGSTSKLILPIKKDLGDLLSLIEVNIDYPEFLDIEEATNEKIFDVCERNIAYISDLIKNGEKGKIIKDGINVALVGKPNVGKSSILNALLEEEKAIVTNIKGTTRDVVEGKIIINGVVINLFDTAGIRESEDIVESKGIEKSKKKILDADYVIAVFDSYDFDDEDKEILNLIKNKEVIYVFNKEDLLKNKENKDFIYISALKNEINPLKNALVEKLQLTKNNYDNPSINNVRQLGLLKDIKLQLENIREDAKNGLEVDILSSAISECYNKVLEILGENYDFDIAKEIFSRFCVGK